MRNCGGGLVRAVIADDHAPLREGLVAVLTSAGFEVAAAVSTPEDLPDTAVVVLPRFVQRGYAVDLIEQHAGGDAGTLDALTARQKEVLSLMATGRSNSSIAQQLSISEKAVVQHASHIYDVLGLPVSPDDHRRVLAVLRYLNR